MMAHVIAWGSKTIDLEVRGILEVSWSNSGILQRRKLRPTGLNDLSVSHKSD